MRFILCVITTVLLLHADLHGFEVGVVILKAVLAFFAGIDLFWVVCWVRLVILSQQPVSPEIASRILGHVPLSVATVTLAMGTLILSQG